MTSPYTPPKTSLVNEQVVDLGTDVYGNPLPRLLNAPRQCQASWGVSWLTQAFNFFKENALLWIGISLTYLIIIFALSMIPLVNLLVSLSVFVFIGGMVKGVADQAEGRELRFDHLFYGFKEHLSPLLILSLLYMLASFIFMIPIFIVLFFLVFASLDGGISSSDSTMILWLVLGSLVALLLMIPVLMSIWFAPALIVLNNIEPVQAMKMSFKACMKNLMPFLVFGLVGGLIFSLVFIFTIGLGMIVVFPIFFIVYYTSYRDVWTDRPLSS